MKIRTWIKYMEHYFPTPRSRKMRFREKEEYYDAELREVPLSKLMPAFLVKNSFVGFGGEIYSFEERLWKKADSTCICAFSETRNKPALEALKYRNENCSLFFDFYRLGTDTRDVLIAKIEMDLSQYLLVDGELYMEAYEPMYNVTTFGLGNNQGGTGLFVEFAYNVNLSSKSYFNALDFDKAIDYAIETAQNRGDSKDAERFIAMKEKNEKPIIVLDPAFVKRNPEAENFK